MKKHIVSPQEGSLSLLGLLLALAIMAFLALKAFDVYFPKAKAEKSGSRQGQELPTARRTDSTYVGPTPSVVNYGSVLTNVRGQLEGIKDRR